MKISYIFYGELKWWKFLCCM